MFNRRKQDKIITHRILNSDQMTVDALIDVLLKVGGTFYVDEISGEGIIEHRADDYYSTVVHDAIQEVKAK